MRVRPGDATYGVVLVDTSVEDVGAGAGTGAVVVDVRAAATAAVGDAAQTPGGVGLADVGVNGEDLLLLDVVDLWEKKSLVSRRVFLSHPIPSFRNV